MMNRQIEQIKNNVGKYIGGQSMSAVPRYTDGAETYNGTYPPSNWYPPTPSDVAMTTYNDLVSKTTELIAVVNQLSALINNQEAVLQDLVKRVAKLEVERKALEKIRG